MRIRREEDDRVLFVSYEDLILNWDVVGEKIAVCLGVERGRIVSEEEERASFGSHGTSDSPTASIGRWRSQLSEEERSWCNASWSEFLGEFGYS